MHPISNHFSASTVTTLIPATIMFHMDYLLAPFSIIASILVPLQFILYMVFQNVNWILPLLFLESCKNFQVYLR